MYTKYRVHLSFKIATEGLILLKSTGEIHQPLTASVPQSVQTNGQSNMLR